MVRVAWYPAAVADIESARSHVAQFDRRPANMLVERLFAAGESLATFPGRGSTMGGACRELTLIRPYIIRYEIVGDEVHILRVPHSAQRSIDE